MATVTISMKSPKWRIRACIMAAWLLSPFIRSEAMGDRVGAAMVGWIKRGVRLHAGNLRIG
ncbi:hypothetical protein D1114_20985 [Cereibacter sphaeroides]|uniref:Uncharacterized protein n=1 Tax=Cereibacter sphaeroides TaxID=1063 RepID=A0AAX1UFM8_CERSP|nr:hypothetical protein [Cereibacter sphaeroides]RHZ91150.1 hypothetical protein D1114_20985 [Cereibacter sphaeroides]